MPQSLRHFLFLADSQEDEHPARNEQRATNRRYGTQNFLARKTKRIKASAEKDDSEQETERCKSQVTMH